LELKPLKKKGYGYETTEEVTDLIKKYLRFVNDPKFGVSDFIPKSFLVIGNNENGEDTVFVVSEKIEGQVLDQIDFWSLPEQHQKHLKDFVHNLTDIFTSSYNGKNG
jgi:hypothetical protein